MTQTTSEKNYFAEQISTISFRHEKEWDNEDKEKFGVLLGAPGCIIRNWSLGYMEINYVDEEDLTAEDDLMTEIEEFLEKLNIHNKEDLYGFYQWWFDEAAGRDYEQFASFWDGTPCFDLNELNSDGKEAFTTCMEFAENFKDIVGEGGFYGWDYSEIVRVIRMGFMMDWLSRKEADELLYEVADNAYEKFHSWKEFAISFICGGTYTRFKDDGFANEKFGKESEFYEYFDKLCDVVQELFSDNSCGEYWNLAY